MVLDLNLFMMCEGVNPSAFRSMPEGFHVRGCRRDELDFWKAMPFDGAMNAEQARFMDAYFEQVYAPRQDEFFARCLFVCDSEDRPVASCFLWRPYDGSVNTMHWFKTVKEYEGRGIGRALLTQLLKGLPPSEYPIYLHTQPGSYRAIKLYSDFGFQLLTDPAIGPRPNQLEQALPYLRAHMRAAAYESLRFASAPQALLRAAASSPINQF